MPVSTLITISSNQTYMIQTRLYSVSQTDFGSLVLHDAPKESRQKKSAKNGYKLLESHFNDLYKMFLKRLTALESKSVIGQEEKDDLKLMLSELLDVKTILTEEKAS